MSTKSLPPEFSDLMPFVDAWALESEKERYWKLHEVTIEELRAFYDAVLPRVDEIVSYLNQHPRGQLPPVAQTLLHLAMTFAETAHPIDLRWKDVDFDDAYAWQKFEFFGQSVAVSK